MFNRAIKSGLMKKDQYPFDDYEISNLKSTPNKRALTKQQFLSIRDLNLEDHPNLLLSIAYFSFLLLQSWDIFLRYNALRVEEY